MYAAKEAFTACCPLKRASSLCCQRSSHLFSRAGFYLANTQCKLNIPLLPSSMFNFIPYFIPVLLKRFWCVCAVRCGFDACAVKEDLMPVQPEEDLTCVLIEEDLMSVLIEVLFLGFSFQCSLKSVNYWKKALFITCSPKKNPFPCCLKRVLYIFCWKWSFFILHQIIYSLL